MGAAESTPETAPQQQPPSSASNAAPSSSAPLPSSSPPSAVTDHTTPTLAPTAATPAPATKPPVSPQKPLPSVPISTPTPAAAVSPAPAATTTTTNATATAPPSSTASNATTSAPPTQSGTVAPLIAFFSQPPADSSNNHPPHHNPHPITDTISPELPSVPPTTTASAPAAAPKTSEQTPASTTTSAAVAPAVSPSSTETSSPLSSSVDELSVGEIAAMEEFILSEAKSHSEVYDHPVWYELVEWSAKFLPSDIVLAWEQHILAYQLLSISKLEKFKKRLDEQWKEKNARKRKIAQINAKLNTQITDSERSTLTNELIAAQSTPLSRFQYEIPFEFARQLLELDKELRVVRHSYVPKRINEDMFWYQYFDTVISSIQAHVISTQAKVKQHNIQHFNRM